MAPVDGTDEARNAIKVAGLGYLQMYPLPLFILSLTNNYHLAQ